MGIRVSIAIVVCKFTRFLLRIFRRGGTALPGKLALGVCPDLLKHLAAGVECIAITGTNGKTTSARMLEQFFIESDIYCITNKSGSNMMRGIAAEFALNATVAGKPRYKQAVIECDEAATIRVFEYLDPKVILITNVFSDQIDRFEDVRAVLEYIKKGVKRSPNAVICINADDSLVSSIADEIPNKIVYFGLDRNVYDNRSDEVSDAPLCIRCNTAYEYDYITYGHLGGFRCPSCGYARKKPDIAVTEITAKEPDSQTVKMSVFGKAYDIKINLPGEYNIYNAAGAIAAALQMGFTVATAKDAMLSFDCGFGRMEKFSLDGIPVRMILAKNAAGCNQVLNYLCNLSGSFLFAICLNDKTADGTDVSWIDHAHFERLLDIGERLRGVFVSGTRADDMARRLVESGIPDRHIKVFKSQGDMLNAVLRQDAPVYIMPTYTAMLEVREIISRKFGVKKFWE